MKKVPSLSPIYDLIMHLEVVLLNVFWTYLPADI